MENRRIGIVLLLLCFLVLGSCSQGTHVAYINDASIDRIVVTTFSPYGLTSYTPTNGQNIKARVALSTSAISDGTIPAAGTITYDSYLSTDTSLSSDDVQIKKGGTIKTDYDSITIKDGKFEVLSDYNNIPVDTKSGDYYLIMVRQGTSETEKQVAVSTKFTINDFTSLGAIKVYNSWGKNWGVASGHDDETKTEGGFYYIPFEAAMEMQLECALPKNSTAAIYVPSILARFKLGTAWHMQDYEVSFNVVNAVNQSIASKSFILDDEKKLPYVKYDKDKEIAYDLTDFYQYLKDGYSIEIQVLGSSESELTFNGLWIDVYQNGYTLDSTPSHTYSYTGTLPDVVTETLEYWSVSLPDIESYLPTTPPVPRSLEEVSYTTRNLSEEEKAEIISAYPERETVLDGGLHTGLVRPDADAYDHVLLAVPVLSDAGANSDLEERAKGIFQSKVDLSDSKYFPPCADQGKVGSCAAFASAYYTMTYEMAKEHDWDLSNVTFDCSSATETDWGPSDTTHIMSPAFIYNQVNGGHSGTTIPAPTKALSLMGCCTWEKMGSAEVYKGEQGGISLHAYTQPSLEAYKEAPLYRLSDVGTNDTIALTKTLSDIKLIVDSLDNGHCVVAGVDSHYLRYCFNENAVLTTPVETSSVKRDHAQTIVGYVTGDEYQKILSQKQ